MKRDGTSPGIYPLGTGLTTVEDRFFFGPTKINPEEAMDTLLILQQQVALSRLVQRLHDTIDAFDSDHTRIYYMYRDLLAKYEKELSRALSLMPPRDAQ